MTLPVYTSGMSAQDPALREKLARELRSGPVRLRHEGSFPGEPARGKVPYHHFKVLREDGTIVGHVNFRVGQTRHVTLCAGHVGFAVLPAHRGHSYAYYACLALAPLIREHYQKVILTTDPSNEPSQRTIRKLGARFLEEIVVPEDDPAYEGGARRRLRFEWTP